MSQNLVFSLSALVAMLPASLFPYRAIGGAGAEGRSTIFWAALALAVAGPVIHAVVQFGGRWHTGLSTTLWVTIAAK